MGCTGLIWGHMQEGIQYLLESPVTRGSRFPIIFRAQAKSSAAHWRRKKTKINQLGLNRSPAPPEELSCALGFALCPHKVFFPYQRQLPLHLLCWPCCSPPRSRWSWLWLLCASAEELGNLGEVSVFWNPVRIILTSYWFPKGMRNQRDCCVFVSNW